MTKNIPLHFLLAILAIAPAQVRATPSIAKLSLYAASATASAYFGYLYCSTPQSFEPTIKNLQPLSAVPVCALQLPVPTEFIDNTKTPDKLYQTPAGPYIIQEGLFACQVRIPSPVWLVSSGWDPVSDIGQCHRGNPNGGLVRRYLKRNIVHGPCVTFVYNDNRRVFNFGQNVDQKSIDLIYQQIQNKEVILHGLCRGASTILGWLEQYPNNNNIKAIILESPAISLKTVCRDTGKKYNRSSLSGSFLHGVFSFYYPHYNPTEPDTLAHIDQLKRHVSKEVPIFIGNLRHDKVTADDTVTKLVKRLREKTENQLYYFVSDDQKLSHAFLSKSKPYQQAINAFLKKYNLPHDAQLAEQGEILLEQARERAETTNK